MGDLYVAVTVPIRLVASHGLSRPGFQSMRRGRFSSFLAEPPPPGTDPFVHRFSASDVTVLGVDLSVFEVGEPAGEWQTLRVSFRQAQPAEAIEAFLRGFADALTASIALEQLDPWYGNLVVDIGWAGMRPERAPDPALSMSLDPHASTSLTMEHAQALTAELLERLVTSDLTEIFADGMRANQPKAKYANWFIPLEELERLAMSDFSGLFTPLFPRPVRKAVAKASGLIGPPLERLQSYLGKPEHTVQNRAEKLHAILVEIGLTEFSVAEKTKVTVDLKMCERLIGTRNSLAHKGTRVEEDLLYNVLYPLSFRVMAYLNARQIAAS